jgi:hypothetical protein
VEKDMAEFTNRKLSKDGKFAWCRECKDKHYNQYRRERGKTPIGKAAKAWENITQRAENHNGVSPEYANVKLLMTRSEFMTWAVPQYEEFMKHNPDVMPSIDRIDSSDHYRMGNLRVVSISDNAKGSSPVKLMQLLSRESDESEWAGKLCDVVVFLCKSRSIDVGEVIAHLQERVNHVISETGATTA